MFDAAGDTLTGEVAVNQYTLDMQNDPKCAFDGQGNLVVSWTSEGQDGDVSGVFARRFGPLGIALDDEFQVNVQTILYQFDSDIVADGNGNVVVVWQSFFGDGDGQGVFGCYFDFATSSVPMPENLRLSQNVPNPFNPLTSIRCHLPEPEAIHLRMFDLSGHLVKTLLAGDILPAGSHDVTWNGLDKSGREVAAGVYFYRLKAGGLSETKRMTLVK
jgi:hypothetical protein